MLTWLRNLLRPTVRVHTEWRTMTEEQRAAFDRSFKAMDAAFDQMHKAFKTIDGD